MFPKKSQARIKKKRTSGVEVKEKKTERKTQKKDGNKNKQKKSLFFNHPPAATAALTSASGLLAVSTTLALANAKHATLSAA